MKTGIWAIGLILIGCIEDRPVAQDDPLEDPGGFGEERPVEPEEPGTGADGGRPRPPRPDGGRPRPPRPDAGPPPPPLDAGRPTPPDAGPAPEVRWGGCPFDLFADRCTTLDVPLDWQQPGGARIEFFVQRFDAYETPRRQLWLIQGGPGAPGDAVASFADVFRQADPGVEVYVPDHRGTGRSSWLGCVDDPKVGPDCQRALAEQYGAEVRHFSATQAARDLGETIALLRQPRQEVLVWGVSYGTVLVNRYAHLYRNQPTALLFDSACPGPGCDFAQWDPNFDRIGRDYLAGCTTDPTCRRALGDDPVEVLRQLYPRLQRGHCAEFGFQVPDLKLVFSYLLMSDYTRALIPAAIHRLNRCGAEDQNALAWFSAAVGEMLSAGTGEGEPGSSDAVYWNIALSELWSVDPPSPAEFRRQDEALLFTTASGAGFAEFAAEWRLPRYSVPENRRRWAPTERPVLLLNGTLDPQTPHFQLDDARQHFTGVGQHVVFLNGAPHGALFYPFDAVEPCGLTITLGMTTNPGGPLADACLRRVAPPSYEVPFEMAQSFFGEPDGFGAGKSRAVAPDPRRRAEVFSRLRERIRRLPPQVRRGR